MTGRVCSKAIVDTLTTIALVRRDVRLTVVHDGKEALALAPAASLRERAAALWGVDAAEGLVDVEDVSGPVLVAVLVKRPADGRDVCRFQPPRLSGQ